MVDSPKCGKYFTSVSRIFSLLLGMTRPLPIDESDRHLAPRCVIMALPNNLDSITVPAGGKNEFEPFEAQFIRTYQPGGPNEEIRTPPPPRWAGISCSHEIVRPIHHNWVLHDIKALTRLEMDVSKNTYETLKRIDSVRVRKA